MNTLREQLYIAVTAALVNKLPTHSTEYVIDLCQTAMDITELAYTKYEMAYVKRQERPGFDDIFDEIAE